MAGTAPSGNISSTASTPAGATGADSTAAQIINNILIKLNISTTNVSVSDLLKALPKVLSEVEKLKNLTSAQKLSLAQTVLSRVVTLFAPKEDQPMLNDFIAQNLPEIVSTMISFVNEFQADFKKVEGSCFKVKLRK